MSYDAAIGLLSKINFSTTPRNISRVLCGRISIINSFHELFHAKKYQFSLPPEITVKQNF